MCSQALITSLLWVWCWGCQVFTVVTIVALVLHYTISGLFIVGYLLQGFLPTFFIKERTPATTTFIIVGIYFIAWHRRNCVGRHLFWCVNSMLYTTFFVGVSILSFVASLSFLVVMIFIGTIFPVILYTIMYIKARQPRILRSFLLRFLQQTLSTSSLKSDVEEQQSRMVYPQYKQSQKRWRRATITYDLLVLSFFFIHFLVDSEDCAVVNFWKIHCLLIWCLVCYNLLSAIQYFCKLWNLAYKQGYFLKLIKQSKMVWFARMKKFEVF